MKVCIVGLKCFDQIANNPLPRYLGGIETQLVVLARGLAQVGCEVSIVTYDHGQADEMHFDGVRVIKSYNPEVGVPGLRSLHPRSTRLLRAMRSAGADVYLQMGAGVETGQVAFGCRLLGGHRRRFVFCLASDSDASFGKSGLEGKVYQRGLCAADRIVAQTEQQRESLRRAVGLEAEVVPMAVTPPVIGGPRNDPPNPGQSRVLWIGRMIPSKRFEWLLEAARRSPKLRFDVVGMPNQESRYAVRLVDEATRLPNVSVHGRVSGAALASLYQQATILCSTSELEGFPTTFLEAWSCGIPVVTTFDPDLVVARHGLGRVVQTPEELISNLHDLPKDGDAYRAASRAAVQYFDQNHAPDRVAQRFRSLLEGVVQFR